VDDSRLIAAILDQGLAGWVDDALASGAPAKWVARQASDTARDIAAMLRGGEPLAGWLAEIADLRVPDGAGNED